jgi:hypothetical protein
MGETGYAYGILWTYLLENNLLGDREWDVTLTLRRISEKQDVNRLMELVQDLV